MSNFLHILSTIGKGLLTASPAIAAVVGLYNPAMGVLINSVAGRIQGAIATAEVQIPGEKQGALKQQAVIADFEAGLGITSDILAARGERITYNEAALKDAIDLQVQAYNRMALVKQSIQIVKFAAPAAA